MGKPARQTVCCALLCLLLSVSTAVAQTGTQAGAWSKQPAGSMAWLHAVFFIDQNRGWAAGILLTTSALAAWSARRRILGTDDRRGQGSAA